MTVNFSADVYHFPDFPVHDKLFKVWEKITWCATNSVNLMSDLWNAGLANGIYQLSPYTKCLDITVPPPAAQMINFRMIAGELEKIHNNRLLWKITRSKDNPPPMFALFNLLY